MTGGRTFHISFILNKSKILSIGINKYNRSSSFNRNYGYLPHQKLHSEMAAAIKLGFINCNGLSIVNFRIDNNGNLANSCYCAACQNLIKALAFKSAHYSDNDGNICEFRLTK